MVVFIGTGAGDTVTLGAGSDTLYGFGGADVLDGGDGRDTLFGGSGDDTLTGGNGADTLFGGVGADTLIGGNGADTIFGGADNDWIYGDAGNNSLGGGLGDDWIFADSGNNTVTGEAGIDRITLGDGNNRINGGADNDEISVGHGNNSIAGGDGDDLVLVGDGNNTVNGGNGADYIIAGSGDNFIAGGRGDDYIIAFGGNNSISGGAGTDTIGLDGGSNIVEGDDGDDIVIIYGTGSNTISGGQGNDVLYAGAGADTLAGNAGDDYAFGGDGNDTLTGGDGVDTLHGGVGSDSVNGGAGHDRLFGGTGSDSLDGATGNDVIFAGGGADVVDGRNGDDTLFGNYGNDLLNGGNGNDTLNGGSGVDVVNAGAGMDVAVYLAAENAGSGSHDLYDGGAGIDALRLILTPDEAADSAVQQDIADYQAFLATHYNPGTSGGATFQFSALDLWVRNFESLSVSVESYRPNLRVNTDAAWQESHPTFGNVDLNFVSASDNGDYVLFWSNAGDLVPGDTDGFLDPFIKDTQTGAITRIDIDTGYNGGTLSISGNGQYVSYLSDGDLVVSDWMAGLSTTIQLNETVGPWAPVSYGPVLSWDGVVVAFTSTSNTLVPGDTANADVFVADMTTGTFTMASTDAAGNAANSSSTLLDMSADGRYVAFYSWATNLVSSDTNGSFDIFVKDMQTGAVVNASTDSGGDQANGSSVDGTLSADGRYLAFTSSADNLVLHDVNGAADVFRKDLQSGKIVLVSRDDSGNQASSAFGAKISADGQSILFYSNDDDLTADDGNGHADLFVKDVARGAIMRVDTDAVGSIGNDGDPFARGYDFSSDGSQIVFWSSASDLVPGDTNNTYDLFMTSNPFF